MGLPEFLVAEMASLSLAGSGLARTAPVPEAVRSPEFDAAHDSDTLWYDAVAIEGRTHVVMPPLANLTPVINDGSLTLDGEAVRIRRRRRSRRHAVLELERAGDQMSISHGRWSQAAAVSPDQADLFEGLNTSVHISRNNDLRWIADWARFHVSAHGLEAMLVMDNASDAYPAEAILEALQPVGLQRAVVLKVPQPYGPPRTKSHSGTAKYLQPAMLNLARLRFLRRARAVLNADIDELVWTKGKSVFDAAVGSALGYVSYKGAWRLPWPDRRQTEPPAHIHADHCLRRRDAKPCPTKYCVVPGGRMGWASWDVHRLDWGLLPSRRLHRDLGYWHCQAITTNWKSYDRLKARSAAPEDPETTALLRKHLPAR